jgi:nucleoid DNA-binding protein
MTKADLVEQVAEAIGPGLTRKECALVVDGFLNAVKAALAAGEHIEIRGFGTFKVETRKPRVARNPRTGAQVKVPSRDVPVFKPSKHLRARIEKTGSPRGR